MTYEEIKAEIRLPEWIQNPEVFGPEAWANCFGLDEWVLRADADGKYRPWDDDVDLPEFDTVEEAMAAVDEDQRTKIMHEYFPHLRPSTVNENGLGEPEYD